ncbi:radial spoke protein [Cymbomonas tetramitiformis]|uniref:Radial spoke protein n=1 Tax=Cymbomonas tetramitiformis TaxID=36881 RepID=A0AAE0G3L1_9CHLO|nr:radial spoke protein [Cymbomonas tetramitiformis]
MAEAKIDGMGLVNYIKFAPIAAHLLWSLIDLKSQTKRMAVIENMRQHEGGDFLHSFRDLSADLIRHILMQAFEDKDQQRTGVVYAKDVPDILASITQASRGKLELAPSEITALLSVMEEGLEGEVKYVDFIDLMYDALAHMARESAINARVHADQQVWKSQI